MSVSRSLISLLTLTSLIAFANYAGAAWQMPTAAPVGNNTEQALNVGPTAQIKKGGLDVGYIKVVNNGYFPAGAPSVGAGRIGAGRGADTRTNTAGQPIGQTIVAAGNVTAPRFCLGASCISTWQEGFALAGGRTNSLVKWVNGTRVGFSSNISEVGNSISVGTGADTVKKTLNVNGGVLVGSGAVSPSSGLRLKGLSSLTPAQLAALSSKNVVLSVDANGEIILVEACNP